MPVWRNCLHFWSVALLALSGHPLAAALHRSLGQDTQYLEARDLVVAFGTTSSEERLQLVKASRAWRKTTRAVITVEQEVPGPIAIEGQQHQETFLVHPDRSPEDQHFSQFPGDARAALAPFLAHQYLQKPSAMTAEQADNYKWMLFGDDDTIWFLDGVIRLLHGFDHNLPYMITDEIFWHTWGGSAPSQFHEEGPPRCLPCHFNQSAYEQDSGALFTPPIGCPCTTGILCQADKRSIFDQECAFPGQMHSPRDGPLYSVDGGAGVLLSIGFMRALDMAFMQECIVSSRGSAGDHIFTYCLWQQGFAITLPNAAAMPSNAAQDHFFSPRSDTDGTTHNTETKRLDLMSRMLWAAEGSSKCDDECETVLLNTVSLHVRSRGLRNLRVASLLIKSMSELYDTFLAAVRHRTLHVV